MWLLLVACRADPSLDPVEAYDPLAEVDPFVATGGQGFEVGSVSPGALVPFGLTKVGPDTRGPAGAVDFLHCAGYHYDDTAIHGFTHTRGHGIGIVDYGALMLMPRAAWKDTYTRASGRAAPFSHDREAASPGAYSVTLDDDGVFVELTATPHGALHRWTFPAGTEPVVVVDLGTAIGSTAVPRIQASVDLKTATLAGLQVVAGGYSGRFGGLKNHFVVTFEPAPVGMGGWTDPDAPVPGKDQLDLTGDDLDAGLWLSFPPGTTEVIARVALSYVDVDGAKKNFEAELGDDFDTTRDAAAAAWREALSGVRVRGGTESERRIFHTAHYHTMFMPTRTDDVDGRYRGNDDAIHPTATPYYNDFSLWDTFRTLHPWLIVAHPDVQADMNRSLVQMAVDNGTFPRWPMGHGETGGMVGTPATTVIAESWLKGLTDFDAETALDKAILQASTPVSPTGRPGVERYVRDGYVAWEDSGGPASLTLEYAWSDGALAAWAGGMGRDTAALDALAGSWANTWDPDRGFFIGRFADGSFTEAFDPTAWANDYVEGGAWQYLWMAPHQAEAMVDAQGGHDAFVARYTQFWADTYAAPDTAFPDPFYWHGNEPDLHYAALGALIGERDLGVAPYQWIRANRYADGPVGLDGNDDGGTLSAWYLWAAVGVFPIAGTDVYAVGTPVFERVEIDGPDGTWVVRAPGIADSGGRVAEARVGDTLIEGTFRHRAWAAAKEITLTMAEP